MTRTIREEKFAIGNEWQKLLWRRQPFPDNYSGGEERFLAEMRKNVAAVFYSLEEATRGSILFLVHLDSVALNFVLFESIQATVLPLSTLAGLCAATVLFAYLLYIFVLREDTKPIDSWDHAATVLTIATLGFALIPVIRTLTTTISTDSIYAMAISAAAASCVFHDYGTSTPSASHPVSLSAGLSSSVLLISRLEDNVAAFIHLSISFLFYAYGAPVRNRLNEMFPNVALAVGAMFAISSTALLWPISSSLSFCWLLFHICVSFVCPRYLVHLQRSKRTIHGPWDEAVLRRRN